MTVHFLIVGSTRARPSSQKSPEVDLQHLKSATLDERLYRSCDFRLPFFDQQAPPATRVARLQHEVVRMDCRDRAVRRLVFVTPEIK